MPSCFSDFEQACYRNAVWTCSTVGLLVLVIFTSLICGFHRKCMVFMGVIWAIPVILVILLFVLTKFLREVDVQPPMRNVSRARPQRVQGSSSLARGIAVSSTPESSGVVFSQSDKTGSVTLTPAKFKKPNRFWPEPAAPIPRAPLPQEPSTPSSPPPFNYAEMSRADPHAAPFMPCESALSSPIVCICMQPGIESPKQPCWTYL